MCDISGRIYCIDVGNTRTHCALVEFSGPFKGGRAGLENFRVEDSRNYLSGQFSEIFCSQDLARRAGADSIAWCSVVPRYWRDISRAIEDCGLESMQLTPSNSPMKIDMEDPMGVGQDRLAAALGASLMFGAPYIVVDMGTAVTIDLVDANGAYAGGAIAPGMHAFAEYLSERAAQLPKINPAEADYSLSVGKNTVEAMYVGCAKGFCKLADGIISDIERDFFGGKSAADKTVFTGGSVELLPKNWLAERKIEYNLVHLGLAYSFVLNKKLETDAK